MTLDGYPQSSEMGSLAGACSEPGQLPAQGPLPVQPGAALARLCKRLVLMLLARKPCQPPSVPWSDCDHFVGCH